MGANRDAVGEFKVVKTTGDSLATELQNLVDDGYTDVQPVHVGGRDWVIIGRTED